MKKFLIIVLLLTIPLYSQINSVLVIHPNGSKYKKMEMAIKGGLSNGISIRSLTFKNEGEIINSISAVSPKMVVVMDKELIEVWKRIQQKHQDINQIPSILLKNDFLDNNVDDLSNICVVSYETKLEHYIKNVIQLTGNKPSHIGVIFSSKSQDLVQSYQNESSTLNVNLHVKPIIISDPENSIKTIVKNFIDSYHVDCMIIINDHVVINNQNINTTWVPLLKPLRIPIAVPSDYFYDCEPKIGSFALQPHYSEIGRVVASVINDAQANGWILSQKSIYTDKSIFYFRNKDGSIGQQNQSQNKDVVLYYPKRKNQTPVSVVSEEKPDVQQEFSLNEGNLNAATPVNHLSQPLTESVNVDKKTVIEKTEKPLALMQKPVTTVASIDKDSKRLSDKKHDYHLTENKSDNSRQKVTQSESVGDRGDVTDRTLHAMASPNGQPKQNTSFQFIATSYNNYQIEITTKKASIYKALTPDLPLLAFGLSGDKFNVTSEDGQWYCIDFSGTPGFISKADARKFTRTDNYVNRPEFILFLIAVLIVLIAVSVFVYVLIMLKKSKHHGGDKVNCLLIAREKKLVKYSTINNKTISLVKYLENFGFHVIQSKNLKHTNRFLFFNIPDIIVVDWQLETDIQSKIYEMLKEHASSTDDFIIIFYNVVDPSNIKEDNRYDGRIFFFNRKFTISDLNNVISEVKVKAQTQQTHHDQSNPLLEGKITEETLTEILQLLDMNKKTGCLHVENHRPIGMIFFEDGMITYAITNTLIAEDALFDILSMKHGRFKFIPGKKPVAKQMELSVVAVLMESAKLLDESQTVS